MASRGRKMPWPGGGTAPNPPDDDQRPSRPAASTATATAQSRFVEGSMNDRVSAAPPPGFLGANDAAAYERQFYEADRPRALRPVSSAGHYHGYQQQQSGQAKKQEPSRKGKFWDGVRERLHLTRSRSSGSIRVEKDRAATMPPGVGSERPSGIPAPPAGYPTREEVAESYKNLMSSGFFESHAIHGTRHPLRATTSHDSHDSRRSTNMGPPLAPPVSFAPRQPFPQNSMRQLLAFSAVPYTSTTQPAPAELPSSMRPPRRPTTGTGETTSPQRGTKRGATPDNDIPFTTETGARKLVKKLRRSASRISADLTGGPPPSMLNTINPFKPRPSTSSNAPTVTSIMSSLTNTSPPPPQRTPTKLTKAKKLPRRGRALGLGNLTISRHRSRSRSRPHTPRRDIMPSPLTMNPVMATAPVFAIPLVDDAMLVDSPERSPQRISLERPATALAPPPSFHYPARRRLGVQEPLSVVPDANRGIPGVPRIPVEFCEVGVFGKGKGQMGGSRDSGLGEENSENVVRVW